MNHLSSLLCIFLLFLNIDCIAQDTTRPFEVFNVVEVPPVPAISMEELDELLNSGNINYQ